MDVCDEEGRTQRALELRISTEENSPAIPWDNSYHGWGGSPVASRRAGSLRSHPKTPEND
jgi:hypothetical protein